MKSSSSSLARLPSQHELYVRARDNPFFDGMRRGDAAKMSRPASFDFREKAASLNNSLSTSYMGDEGLEKDSVDTYEEVIHMPSKDSTADICLETIGQSSSGMWSKEKRKTFPFPYQSDFTMEFNDEDKLPKELSIMASELNEECHSVTDVAKPAIKKIYTVKKRSADFCRIPLCPSAASFYSGFSPQMEVVESCESIQRLNLYLKARRSDVNAGVPGKFLHAVIGQDNFDVGSIVSTIMYAFYLNETMKSSQLCTVPVINMKRADMNYHAELKWLLDSCHIDQASLICVDEIDLSYYDLYGSLKLVLLNGDELPAKQEPLKEALVEIFNSKKDDSLYPSVSTVTVGQDCSSCTLISEKFALSSPEILAGQGFSRFLLAGILLDTGNLTTLQCTSKDKYMATLLLNGAGRFGCNGLYQILRYKMYDVSDLRIGEILRKDFKKWTRIGKPDGMSSQLMISHIGMSSIGIPIAQFLAHEDTSTQEVIHFQKTERLRLLMVVSGYYDNQKNFKREILVAAESIELTKNLLNFFNSNSSQLPLNPLPQPGLREEIKLFEIGKVTSRKTIEKLLEEFC